MRVLFISLGLLIILILGALFVAPTLVPSDTYRTTIQEQLSRELGRPVNIEGDVSLSTFPRIKATTGRAEIANPDGFSREHFVSIEGLETRIKLLPLFSRRVEISRFTLIEPDILLERLANGDINWALGPDDGQTNSAAESEDDPGTFKRDGRYANIDPSLGAVSLDNGRLTYIDRRANIERKAEAINLSLSLPSMEETLNLDGSLTLDGKPVDLDLMMDSPRGFLNGLETRLVATLETDGAALSIDGTIPSGDSLAFDGSAEGDVSDPSLITDFITDPIAGLELLNAARASVTLSSQGADGAPSFTDLKLDATGDDFSLKFTGSGSYSDALQAQGDFDVTLDRASAVARAVMPDLTSDADVIGTVMATGSVALKGERIEISGLSAKTQSDTASSQFDGTITIANNIIGANGQVSGLIPSLDALNAATQTDIPYSDAVGQITFDGTVSGSSDELTLSDVTAALTEGDFNGDYSGSVIVSDRVALDGTLSVKGQSIRALAERTGTALPPSTNEGEIFENFAFSGQVKGPVDQISLTESRIQVDDLIGTGQFNLSMTGDKPLLSGTLAMTGLDLRPYMAAYSAQRPEGAIQPWSETPIPTDGLRAINADLAFTTPSIKLSRLGLGQTNATAQLQDGIMTVSVPEMGLYGGTGTGRFILDGRSSEPQIEINAQLGSLDTQNFLSAIAGFAQASGVGKTEINLKGSGLSQAAIMQSLTGLGDFTLKDGSISGIDAGEFLTGLQQALTSRALPSGLGPTKSTQFQNLIGGFSMTNGVAKIDDFTLSAAQVQVEAGGEVDLGAQTIDFRFRPKTVGENATGIAAFGIPLQFTGPFGAAKPQLDSDFLGDVIQARAAAEARTLISDRIGGQGGDVVGGVLGSILGGTPQSPEENSNAEGATETPETDPETGPETDPEAAESKEETRTEEVVEDALRGLFGRKKKD